MSQIFVKLMDEAVDVWKPVMAVHVRDSIYLISAPDDDSCEESWQFQPGEAVVCEQIPAEDGTMLAAVRLSS
jgi:hypothetical protein